MGKRATSDEKKVYRLCKECKQETNVSADTKYDEDNYTCHICSKDLIRKNAKLDGRPILAHKQK